MDGFFGFVFGLAVIFVWIVIGWRAMIAHESIARSLERMRREQERQP